MILPSEVLRQVLSHEGAHYRVVGAHPGPAPAHDVEIWVGAYKPRMLALTGAQADGWLPSMGYADVDALPAMNAAIDEAAREAGRRPAEVRRLYNIVGRFGTGSGLLEGAPRDWALQLSELTLTQGMSTYILSAQSGDDVRRFAADVVPAVRELVETERGRAEPEPATGPVAFDTPEATPLVATPTPDDGTRLSDERIWDETSRPSGPAPDPKQRFTVDQQAAGQHLIDVHDGLRAEVARLRDLIDQVAEGTVDPAAARAFVNRMTIRQNRWTLGVYCASYCRMVAAHHTLEDRGVFPHLRRRDPQLEPVLDRLGTEHEVIADIVERVDRALAALVSSEPDAMTQVRNAVNVLTDAMASHLSYEERELVEPLARHGFY